MSIHKASRPWLELTPQTSQWQTQRSTAEPPTILSIKLNGYALGDQYYVISHTRARAHARTHARTHTHTHTRTSVRPIAGWKKRGF